MSKPARKTAIFAGLTLPYVVLAAVLSLFALRFSTVPYFWICMAWWPCALFAASKARNGRVKVVLYNVFLFLLLIGFVELAYDDNPEISRTSEAQSSYKQFVSRDSILGYAPNPDNIVRFRRRFSNGENLEAVYTINHDGLRKTMPSELEGRTYDHSILFFGCSFTFGHGVADSETLPFYVGRNMGWRYKVYNFGFEGYGPHQMLAALENGIVSRRVTEPPKFVVYQAITAHINRVIHGNPWMRAGPEYRLVNGKPKYVGPFKYPSNVFLSQLNKSFIYKRLSAELNKWRRSDEAQRLFVEIVKASRDRVTELYPDCKFEVVFWGSNPSYRTEYDTKFVISELRKAGIDVYEVKDIIQGDLGPDSKFRIPLDGHPNGLAYERIANFLTNGVLK